MHKINELLTIVRRADFQEIEFARDRVIFSDLGALAADLRYSFNPDVRLKTAPAFLPGAGHRGALT